MKVVIDLTSHQAIQDFTVNSPAAPYQFKSQDTVEWELFFVQDGIVQDLGAGFALKFGMIKSGDPTNTLLAYQTTFNYLTDSVGRPYYSGLVNFNTSQMATAIGTSPSISGTAEIRYQDSVSEIIHTINIPTIVYATILVETGVTPPGVSSGYPDASTIELLAHKNAASGYAGLTASSKLTSSVIPVDTQTINIDTNGNISSAAILAYTTANFTTAAANANVTVTVNSTTGLKANSYVRIPIAGYYVVQSITDSTHAVLTNNGDPFNASSGVTILTGSVLLPAQAAAGGGSGQGAYTATTASFTVPAVGAAVTISVGSTAWMGGNGYALFITGAGYYLVSSIVDGAHVSVTNSGGAANALSGSTIASGAAVSSAGPMGPSGPSGQNLAAYDTLSAGFTMPNAGASVTVTLTNTTAWMGIGQVVYIAGAGYFSVASVINATTASVTNLNYPGNAAAAGTIASGAHIGPGGLQGATGAGGAGLNAFTTLSANFTQPAVNSSVTATVGTTAWMALNQIVFITGGGYYSVASISDLTHASLTNLGYTGNAPPAAIVSGSGTQTVTPAGLIGSTGIGAYTTTMTPFVMPAALQSVSVTVASTAFLIQNQNIYIGGAGYFSVSNIVDGTHITAINLGSPGNVSSGTTIPVASGLTVSGATGPAINTGGGFSTAADAISVASGTEVSHIASQSGGVLALKKLKTGPAGSVVLTDQGGTTGDILVDVPVDGTTITVSGGKLTASGGGGAGGLITADTGIQVQEDFTLGSAPPNWSISGTGGTVSYNVTNGCDATNKGAGVIGMSAGSSGANRCVAIYGAAISQADGTFGYFVPALGILEMRFRVWMSSVYSGTTNYAIARLGLITDDGTGVIRNGIFFEYNYSQGSGNWIATTVSAGTFSRNATTTAVVATQWMNLRITTDAAWANANFYVNGTSVKAISGFTLPTNNMPLAIYYAFGAGTGLSSFFTDYAYLKYSYSRGSW